MRKRAEAYHQEFCEVASEAPSFSVSACTTLPPSQFRFLTAINAAHRAAVDSVALLLQFHHRHQKWPKSLEELLPTYLEALPIDPFTAAPLRFAVVEEGIVIYSIGEDLVDDGGLVARQKKRPHLRDVGVRLHKPEHRGLLLIDDPPDEKD